MNKISYGYFDRAVPLNPNLFMVDQPEVLNAGGDTSTHKNIFVIQGAGDVIYCPVFKAGTGNIHGYFDRDENIILSEIQWNIRCPDYARSWIKDIRSSGWKALTDGTLIERFPVMGADGSKGVTPFYRENVFFPPKLELNYFLNIHPAGQVLDMQCHHNYELQLKVTDTDLEDFYYKADGDDYEAHHLYITFTYKFIHTKDLIFSA